MEMVFRQESPNTRQRLEGLTVALYGRLREDKRTRHLLRYVHKERYCWQQAAWLEHYLISSGVGDVSLIRHAYGQLLDSMELKPGVSAAFLEHVDYSLQEVCL